MINIAMRLFEIFDTDQEHYQSTDDLSDVNVPTNPERRGHFSYADDHKDPHLVTKAQHSYKERDQLADAFPLYAEIVSKHKLWDMIHFPRVYKIGITSDPWGSKLYDWEMEKLLSYEQLSESDVQQVADTYFQPKLVDTLVEKPFLISQVIKKVYSGVSSRENIVDDQLLKCIEVLHKVEQLILAEAKRGIYKDAKNVSIQVDLHEGNVMFRRTQYGVQPVISDPFAFNIEYT